VNSKSRQKPGNWDVMVNSVNSGSKIKEAKTYDNFCDRWRVERHKTAHTKLR